MTKRKKDKNKTEAGLSSATGSQMEHMIAVDRGYESGEAASHSRDSSVAGGKSVSGPEQVAEEEMDELPGRLQNRLHWESASPYSDVLWLTEMLQHTSFQLTHRYNLVEMPGCAAPQVMAALFVAQAWPELVSGG
jgi:hypothetical protein